MARFRLKVNSCCAFKALRWNHYGLRYKGTVVGISKKSSSQGGSYSDVSESGISFPFTNPSKAIDYKEALSSLLFKPLSIHYDSKRGSNGERVYLEKFQSVTSILSVTKPLGEYFALKNWKKAQISELGEEKFKEKKKNISERGTSFHHDAQMFFTTNEDPSMDEGPNSGYWKSVSHVLKQITNVVAVESSVLHPSLGYAGTLDLIAEYKGVLSVIDWKTSEKRKPKLKDCYSYPQQVVAYAGAVNFDGNYPFQVFEGVLVIAYQNGDPADVHHLNQEMCQKYWLEWLARLQEYRRKFPEAAFQELDQETHKAEKEMHGFKKLEPMANVLNAKPVSSFGTPSANLGTVVKDEDVIKEKPLLEEDRKTLFSLLVKWTNWRSSK